MAGIGDSLNLGLGDALQSIKNAAGIVDRAKNFKGAPHLPWDKARSNIQSTFFSAIDIDSTRWNQLFPYRLVVVDTSNGQTIVGGSPSIAVSSFSAPEAPGTPIISFTPLDSRWIFNLPISPQQLSITDQYAINTTATLRGVLEEHNGLKFKLINASGTMGVWPYKTSASVPPTTPGILQSIFGGTLEAIGSLVQSATSVVNALTGNSNASKPVTITPDLSDAGPASTGYYNALALQQFLEQYAEAKKDPKKSGWRLVFDIPKQNQSFVVTPMQYVWQQNQSKPLEFLYNFQLKAWRRIDLNEPASFANPTLPSISPGILQRIMNTISAARTTAAAATNLIGAVRSDVETPLNVLRQTSLLVKDLAGVAVTAADLPSQIIKDYSSSIAASMTILSSAISSTNSDPLVAAALAAVVASSIAVEGLSQNAISAGQLGIQATINQTLNTANSVFTNPDQNFTLLDQVPVASLVLTNAQQNVVDQIIQDARDTTIDTLKKYKATIQQLALQLSNSFGTGDAFYSKVYGQPAPTKRIQPITLDEYEILKAFYDMMQAYDLLTATTQIDDDNKQTNMEYVAGLADLSGIPFTVTTSKTLAPVPFGLSIEAISLRYLGDPQRWIEIATLNNLRDPYIDENGFQLPLLSNATGRQITIPNISNLYIGQRVLLMSATQIPSARTILGIDRLSDTSFLLTLDGLPNLDSFTLFDKAFLQAYLPGTVNSQQKIFIPSDLPVSNDPNVIPPPSTSTDPLTGLSKVDWLLTDTGDVAINNFADFRYSSGITNIIQALKIKLSTQQGKWLTHPDFGLSLKVGMSSSDVDVQQIFNSINTLVTSDPRFQGISNLQIALNGPTVSINLGVFIAGQSGVFPVNFTLNPS